MELLLMIMVVVLALAVLAASGVACLAWMADRSNRVSPTTSSPAPMTWLCSPSRLARLHRRLQTAVAPIHVQTPKGRAARRATLPPAGSLPALRLELEAQAVEIDRHIRMVSRYPRAYRPAAVRQLDRDVRQVEQISVRLQRMTRPPGQPTSGWDAAEAPPQVLHRIADDLDRLEAAQAELDHIEKASGLVSDQVLRDIDARARQPRPEALPPPAAQVILPTDHATDHRVPTPRT